MVSINSSNEQKHEFPYNEQKISVSLNLFQEGNTKKLDYVLVDKNPEPCNDSEPITVIPLKKV